MLESNIPEIDAEALLKQVQIEAERLGGPAAPAPNSDSGGAMPRTLPALRPVPRMASLLPADLGEDKLKQLHDLLERARQAAELSRRIPKPFRKFFRQQDKYNALLIQSVIPLFESMKKFIHWQHQLSSGLHARSAWLTQLAAARTHDANAVHSLSDKLEKLEATANHLQQQLQSKHIASLQTDLASFRHSLASLEERYVNDASFIKAQLTLQAGLLQRTPNGPAKADEPVSSGQDGDGQYSGDLDAFYFSFENRFRGDRDDIKDRLKFYLPFLEQAKAGSDSKPVVDLGCGRGEWLELLRERGLTGTGVDLNEAMIAQCRERQLTVHHANALEFLRHLPEQSAGAITGFHIIEHVPLPVLINLFTETLRVLQPGGIAIFESPNCKNVLVGASNFHIDPTHRSPVHPETAQFMLETYGFQRVRLEFLAPVYPADTPFLETIPAPVRELLYGAQDFAVIGYKSTAS